MVAIDKSADDEADQAPVRSPAAARSRSPRRPTSCEAAVAAHLVRGQNAAPRRSFAMPAKMTTPPGPKHRIRELKVGVDGRRFAASPRPASTSARCCRIRGLPRHPPRLRTIDQVGDGPAVGERVEVFRLIDAGAHAFARKLVDEKAGLSQIRHPGHDDPSGLVVARQIGRNDGRSNRCVAGRSKVRGEHIRGNIAWTTWP